MIVRAGVDSTWNGRSFTASPGWYHTFWVRDMCFSAAALARLSPKDKDRLSRSLAWAIDRWERKGSHVTTTFHIGGFPADVYAYGVDSLPLLLAALRAADGDEIVARHHDWLTAEVADYASRVIDPATGLVRADRTFSAHRDTTTNRSNCYGNSMVALLVRTLRDRSDWNLALPPVLDAHFGADPGSLLRSHFWMTERGCFRDALGSDDTSGEANIWPFWTGVIGDPEMLSAAFTVLREDGYADPLPLRYTTTHHPEQEVFLVRHLLPDYQGSTIWTSLGAMYLQLLRTFDGARAETATAAYRAWIERDGTFWEVLDRHGRNWWGRFRLTGSDESMLWGSIFLDHLLNPTALPATLAPVRVSSVT